MKLNELLQEHWGSVGSLDNNILTPETLEQLKERLSQCDEFQGSQIEIIPTILMGKPRRVMVGQDDEGPVFEVRSDTMTPENEPINTYKLDTKLKFGPRVKLYSISLTPTMYDPKDVFETPVNSVYVLPASYDPKTFTPLKRLILTFSPEQAQDAAMGLLKMELNKMDEEKQEFVVSNGEEIDQTLRMAENQMQTVNKDDIATLIKEEENKYMEELIEMVRNAMTSKTKDYTFPGKRGILLRMTTDSVINDDAVIRSEDDIYLKA